MISRKRVSVFRTTASPSIGIAVIAILASQAANAEDGINQYVPGAKQLATLDNVNILESSGLAASHDVANRFWTHNDSGDGPHLYAFDAIGRDLGRVSLAKVEATDWEDLSSFRRDNRGWLLVADVGDNARRRETCQLHFLPEPDLKDRKVEIHSTVTFRYANGPRDCEAVGIDASSNTVLLISKVLFQSEVYSLQIPPVDDKQILIAQSIARISVPLITGLDVSPDGSRAIAVTYGNAYEFRRRQGESWARAFARTPEVLRMPNRKQGESICYGLDGRSLFLTSERQPTPLWKVERTP